MIIRNEYKNEYGPFLYKAMLILDNYASKRTSQIFVLLVNVNEWQLQCTGMVAKFPFVSKYPGITAALYRNGRIPILFSTIQPTISTIHVALYKNRLYSYSLLIIIVKLLRFRTLNNADVL